MSDDQSVNEAIETYRQQLTAEAELARGDLDEIEDHMRTLIDDLRATGMPVGAAVTEAARRLGNPKQVAREHTRVGSPFGERLPRGRAWLAAAVLAPVAVRSFSVVLEHDFGAMPLFGSVLMLGLVAALALRLSWARPLLFGQAVTGLLWTAAFSTLGADVWSLIVLAQVATAVLLAPSRRFELGTGGWALALLVPAYAAGEMFGMWQLSIPGGGILQDPMPLLAIGAASVAGTGIVLRARWAAPAAALSAVALAAMGPILVDMTWRFEHPDLQRAVVLGILGLGVVGAALGAVFAWRNARSNLGTLKYVLV